MGIRDRSYHKDEKITPEQAHRNALQLAENTPAWKGFEVLVATHKDKDHIHTHFIVNSVNFEDGHKLQWSSADPVSYTHLDVYKRQVPTFGS